MQPDHDAGAPLPPTPPPPPPPRAPLSPAPLSPSPAPPPSAAPPPPSDAPPHSVPPATPESRAIFVGNFEYESKTTDLERLFSQFGPISRIDLKRGFAFVFMQSEADGQAAINALDGHIFGELRRRTLKVEWARGDGAIKRREDERRRRLMDPSETLFVVNFDPSTTTRHRLDMLFAPYGPIVRLDLQQRFAFIQYEHLEHATAALRGLNGTPLGERHLIVEYTIRGGTQPNRKRIRDRPNPYDMPRPIHPLRDPYRRARSPSPRSMYPRSSRLDRPWGSYARDASRSPRLRSRDRPYRMGPRDDEWGPSYRGGRDTRDRLLSDRDRIRSRDRDRMRGGDFKRYRSRSPSPIRAGVRSLSRSRSRTQKRSRSRSPSRDRTVTRGGASKGMDRRCSVSRSRSRDGSPIAKRRREDSRSPGRGRDRSKSPGRHHNGSPVTNEVEKSRLRDMRRPSPRKHRSRSKSRERKRSVSRERSRHPSPERTWHRGRNDSRSRSWSRSPVRKGSAEVANVEDMPRNTREERASFRSSDGETQALRASEDTKERPAETAEGETENGSPRRTPSTYAYDRPMVV